MPRDSRNEYSKVYPSVEAGTTISSTVYNGNLDDLVNDLNTARPISAGGTGGTTAAEARSNFDVAQKQGSLDNTASGLGLLVGSFGLGSNAINITDWDAVEYTGMIKSQASSTTGAPTTNYLNVGLNIRVNSESALQIASHPDSGRVFRRIKDDGSWGDWSEMHTQASTVGTVSESSGVPTGAIIESSGSSSRAVLFADGTMIAHIKEVELSYVTDNYLGGRASFAADFMDTNFALSICYRPPTAGAGYFATDCTPAGGEILPASFGQVSEGWADIRAYRMFGGTSFVDGDLLYATVTAHGRWY